MLLVCAIINNHKLYKAKSLGTTVKFSLRSVHRQNRKQVKTLRQLMQIAQWESSYSFHVTGFLLSKGILMFRQLRDFHNLDNLKLTMACSILLSIEPCPAPDALQKRVLVSRIWLATVFLCTSKDKRAPLVDWLYLCLEHLWCTYVHNQR